VDVSLGAHPPRWPASPPGVRTRQLLLDVLAQDRRAGVLRPLARRGGAEELRSTKGDPLAALPVVAAAAAMLVSPRTASLFHRRGGGQLRPDPAAWARILASAPNCR